MEDEQKRNRSIQNNSDGQAMEYETTEAPPMVLHVKRLQGDDTVLKDLTKFTIPPLEEVRCITKSLVF